MKTLVVAPHPDDEVLGAGGTIARDVAEGSEVYVLIVTKGGPPLFDEAHVTRVSREVTSAHRHLGIRDTVFLNLPAARLSELPHHELNERIGEAMRSVAPTKVVLPFRGDLHLDHRLVFDSCLVALRPGSISSVKTIWAYETLSETNWNASRGITSAFVPDIFVDIGQHLEAKIEAMSAYKSQLRSFPNERSIDAIRSLARYRGAMVGLEAAEAFMLVRQTI